jgi:hypothetical protein
MIVNIFGDTTRQNYLEFLPRPCRVTSLYSRLQGDIVDPPVAGLAFLAAMLRGQPGKGPDQAIWNLRELAKIGSRQNGKHIEGTQASPEELQAMLDHPMVEYIRKVYRKEVTPSTIILNPVEDWWTTMVLGIQHSDHQWATSLRERRVNETLYWLQREIPVILVSGRDTRYEPSLSSAVERQCDLIIRVEQGQGYLTYQRDYVKIPVTVGDPVLQDHVLSALGLLSVLRSAA